MLTASHDTEYENIRKSAKKQFTTVNRRDINVVQDMQKWGKKYIVSC